MLPVRHTASIAKPSAEHASFWHPAHLHHWAEAPRQLPYEPGAPPPSPDHRNFIWLETDAFDANVVI